MRLRKEAQYEKYRREERGEGDIWSDMQRLNAQEKDNNLVQKKFRIEMRFSQPGDSDEKLLYWYHATVTETANRRKVV